MFVLNLLTSPPISSLVTPTPEVSIVVSDRESKATAAVGSLGDLTLTTSIIPVSGSCFTETYKNVEGAVKFDFPDAARYSRDLYVTYLDEEIMVVRDGSGVAEVLVRTSEVGIGEEVKDRGEWGIQDIDEEDMVPPVD